MLAVAVLVSTVAAEKTHALGLSLAGWLWVVLLHDLVAFAAIAGLSVPVVAAALAGWVVVPTAVAARLLGRRRV